ncbi:MAG TPA: GNAT family N-acetyltransferase, partial [Bryobacteraceae bacterium]|nr:GNAT family N-acetyltransferase [Bryobacteraceae bacterium]
RVQYWPIFVLADGGHAGCAGLRPYRLESLMYELGFHLRPPYWGLGFAEESARAVIRYAAEAIGAKTLFAGHHPSNDRSRRVLEKLGFQPIGVEFHPPTGLMHPSYHLSI